MPKRASTKNRKTEHLDVCRECDVSFQTKTAWFEYAELVHQAVPSFGPADVDISVSLLGRTLSAPFIIGAMTGGTPEAGEINRALARVAAEKGVGFALGSQRAMLEDPDLAESYRVRDAAPDALVLGNIGLPQAIHMTPEPVEGLMKDVGADGMCLHLNAAMEMFQADGDAPTGDADAAIRNLAAVLGERLIVKETGCGISRETAIRLSGLGVQTLDLAGAGGTSWVRVENLRRGGAPKGMEAFEEWGIPTAASLLEVDGVDARIIASGGLRSGLDLAKAIVLGAQAGSAALPVLRAYYDGGVEAVGQWIDSVINGLRAVMVLTGCRDLTALRVAPMVAAGPLLEWVTQRRSEEETL